MTFAPSPREVGLTLPDARAEARSGVGFLDNAAPPDRASSRVAALVKVVESVPEGTHLRRVLTADLREGLRRNYSLSQLEWGFAAEGYEGIIARLLRVLLTSRELR